MKSPLGLRVLLFSLVAIAAPSNLFAATQATIYASPNGKGTQGTAANPCSLEEVRNLVRKINGKMTGDIVVLLRGGTYELQAPFTLTEIDSGSGGFHVIYKAAPGETPILSGGRSITGWSLSDASRNVYRAKVPSGSQSRQFYIDGRRAVRARGPLKPEGWNKTAEGWGVTDPAVAAYTNVDDIEVVSRSSWKHLRCGVASISGTNVVMKMPGWKNASVTPHPGNPWNGGGTQQMNKVEWIENAIELLDEPGEWYLDRKAGWIYYIPLPGESMKEVKAVLPVLEQVLDIHGADYTHRIQDVEFSGITFAYATWMGPSGNEGYADNQAGVLWVGNPPKSQKTPGNISFQYASGCRFTDNVVAHMGGCGIDFGHGPQRNVISGNCVFDISGNGIFLGEVDDYNATEPTVWTEGNIIQNNLVREAGVEFEDQVGICVGYTRHLVLDHNEVCNLPYSGISVGWGWSKLGYSFQNTITNNHIHDFMRVLGDGGGIYTLGNQGAEDAKTIWSGNYVHHGAHAQGLYADEGSGFMDLSQNVVAHVGANWVNLWTKSIHDISVHDNFADKSNLKNNGTNCTVENNVMDLKPEQMEEGAAAIAKKAGLEPAYASLWNKIPKPTLELVDDTDPKIQYEGAWSASSGRKLGDLNDTVHFARTSGASATYAFTGKGIEVLMETNKDEGTVEVSIDGAVAKNIDCKTETRGVQQVMFSQDWPEEAPHVIKVESVSGGFIVLDGFKVRHRKAE